MSKRREIPTNNCLRRLGGAWAMSVPRPFKAMAMYMALWGLVWANAPVTMAQTRIHPSQIEDAYLLNTGDISTGDIVAATSKVSAATLLINGSDALGKIFAAKNGDQEMVWLGSNGFDIRIDPNYNLPGGSVPSAFIQLATAVGFDDVLGDKIAFWSDSYKIGLSPFDLDITSDRNIKFHSDTVENLFQILGDEGDVIAKRDITAGGDIYATTSFRFVTQEPGDKLFLYYPQYKLSISPSDLDVYSDRYIKFHSDSNEDAAILDANTGNLTLEGRIQSASAVVGATNNPVQGYSLVADTAWIGHLEGVENGQTDNDWIISGNDLYSAASGNVGIGTATPDEKLTLNGVLSLSDQDAAPPPSEHYAKLYVLAATRPGGIDNYTVLNLHADGNDGDTSFPDSSSSAHTVTAHGDAQVDTSVKKWDTGSAQFDGAGDYLRIPDNTDWNFGSGDFTIDCWIYCNNVSSTGIVVSQWENNGGTDKAWALQILSGGYVKAYGSNGSDNFINIQSTGTLNTNTWRHIAYVRNGATAKIYINGIEDGSDPSASGTLSNSGVDVVIGGQWAEGGGTVQSLFNGYVDELRISKGIARWTSNFTPPTSAYKEYFTNQTLYLKTGSNDILSIPAWTREGSALYVQSVSVGIETGSPGRIFELGNGAGNARADGWDIWSARQFKKDIVPLSRDDQEKFLSELKRAPLSRYRYKAESSQRRKRIGFLVEDAPPSIVSPDNLSISLGDGLGYLFAAQKALLERVEMLEESLREASIPIPTPTGTPLPTATVTPTAGSTEIKSATQ